MKKDPTEKELRARGYMTPDQFLERLLPGLQQYLYSASGDDLSHPEDLISNTLAYIEVAYLVIGDFGAGPEKKLNHRTIEAIMKATRGIG
jgi:hypothetical protein